MNYIIYHKSDLDGISSAALIYKYVNNSNIKLIPCDYDDNNESIFDILNDDETDKNIYIVDFSFPSHIMKQLYESYPNNLYWIDHHITAIKQSVEDGYDNISGKRDIQFAACELVYMFINGTYNIPKIIKLLGRYDIWAHNDVKNCVAFNYGLRYKTKNPTDQIWNLLLDFNNNDNLIDSIIENGNVILEYLKTEYDFILTKTHSIIFENMKCICINTHMHNSLIFKNYNNISPYQIHMVYSKNNLDTWKVSLYSNNDSEVNVSEIAKKYGGGGHKNAAGFYCDNITFNNIFCKL